MAKQSPEQPKQTPRDDLECVGQQESPALLNRDKTRTGFQEPLVLHATNVLGLGAQQVVLSLLDALLPLVSGRKVTVFLPEHGLLADYQSAQPNVQFVNYRRKLPRQISRLLECLWPARCFRGKSPLLVLGDIPLAGRSRQVVFVHQTNLLAPTVNTYVGQSCAMRTMRAVFRRNHPIASAVIVQTDVIKEQLEQSYLGIENRLHVIPQPPPNWVLQGNIQVRQARRGALQLFYPAAGYPHKNHKILQGMGPLLNTVERKSVSAVQKESEKIRVAITLQEEPTEQHRFPDFVENLGQLDVTKVQQIYQQTDALFFPSVLESLGLPLVEAICIGLPIVCSDLPYARWVCEDQACYFDPESPSDAVRAIYELRQKLNQGWRPDYRPSLKKLPDSWQQVAERFLQLLAEV